MTLSPDLRHTIVSHTTPGIPILERQIRAKSLIRKYRITDEKDIAEVAMIAGVPREKLDAAKPAVVQQRIS